nr:MAG TPA: hypothetical protein [Caudoviricetes sp.]
MCSLHLYTVIRRLKGRIEVALERLQSSSIGVKRSRFDLRWRQCNDYK